MNESRPIPSRLQLLLSVLLLSLLAPLQAFAQDTIPSGIWSDTFLSDVKGKKAIVIPGNSSLVDETNAAAKHVIASMYESKSFALVMDAAPLGSIEGLSDADRLAASRTVDQALACLVSAFPAPQTPRIVIRCIKSDDSAIEFIGTADEPNSFFQNKAVILPPDPLPKERVEAPAPVDGGAVATGLKESATDVAETISEQIRPGGKKLLAHSPTRLSSRRIVAGLGEPIAQDVFYELTGRPELADTYRSRGKTKMTLYITSSVALAAGAGLLFVGLADGLGSDSAILPISGIAALALGAAGISWGLLIPRYPTSIDEDLQAIDAYNNAP